MSIEKMPFEIIVEEGENAGDQHFLCSLQKKKNLHHLTQTKFVRIVTMLSIKTRADFFLVGKRINRVLVDEATCMPIC